MADGSGADGGPPAQGPTADSSWHRFFTTLPGQAMIVAALLTAVVGGWALARGGEPSTTNPDETASPSPTGTSTPAPGNPIALDNWQGGSGWFAISPGDTVDLDAGDSPSAEDADLYWDGTAGTLVSLAAQAAVLAGNPGENTPLTCQETFSAAAAEEEEPPPVEFAGLRPGSPLCVRTDGGLVAALSVVGVDDVGGQPGLVIEGTSSDG